MIKLEEFIRGISHGSQTKIYINFKFLHRTVILILITGRGSLTRMGGMTSSNPCVIPNLTLSLIIKLRGLTLPLNGLFRKSSAPKVVHAFSVFSSMC